MGSPAGLRSPADAVEAQAGRLEARLLVVEDEPTILELLSGSLRFAGFDVVTAASGRAALRGHRPGSRPAVDFCTVAS
jgi:DNA-binding NtrC family response regulator